MDELTYEERYEIPLKLVVRDFRGEYSECGSHEIELNVVMSLEEVEKTLKQILALRQIAEKTPTE